jgi:hypothetical protein
MFVIIHQIFRFFFFHSFLSSFSEINALDPRLGIHNPRLGIHNPRLGIHGNVLSYSLFGANPRYFEGAIANSKLYKIIYPGWIMRVYYDNTVPTWVIKQLRDHDVELINMTGSKMNKMSWRFQAASNSVRFCSRDIDSRLSLREKSAVDEWIQSKKYFHIMRDHPSHSIMSKSSFFPILGGMWGSKNIPNINRLLMNTPTTNKQQDIYLDDMIFLTNTIWPMTQVYGVMQHDSFSCNQYRGSKPFPLQRVGFEHVGSSYMNGKDVNVRDLEKLKQGILLQPKECKSPPKLINKFIRTKPYQIPCDKQWCNNDHNILTIHQNVPGCGRVCSGVNMGSGDRLRGVFNDGSWSKSVPCSRCPLAEWPGCTTNQKNDIQRDKIVAIIPTCDKSIHVLNDAVLSALKQSQSVEEVVIAIDSWERCHHKLNNIWNDNRINIVHVPQCQEGLKCHGRAGRARNYGMKYSKTIKVTHWAFLDDDDVWLYHKIQNQMNIMHAENVEMISSDAYSANRKYNTNRCKYYDGKSSDSSGMTKSLFSVRDDISYINTLQLWNGGKWKDYLLNIYGGDTLPRIIQPIEMNLANLFVTSSTIISNNVIENFDEAELRGQDYTLWKKIIKNVHSSIFMHEPQVIYANGEC